MSVHVHLFLTSSEPMDWSDPHPRGAGLSNPVLSISTAGNLSEETDLAKGQTAA